MKTNITALRARVAKENARKQSIKRSGRKLSTLHPAEQMVAIGGAIAITLLIVFFALSKGITDNPSFVY